MFIKVTIYTLKIKYSFIINKTQIWNLKKSVWELFLTEILNIYNFEFYTY